MSRLKDIKEELKREIIKRVLWKLKTFFNYKVPDDRPSLFNLFEKDGNYYLLNREKGRIIFNGYKKTSDDGLCFKGDDIEAYLKKGAKWRTVMDGGRFIAIELEQEPEEVYTGNITTVPKKTTIVNPYDNTKPAEKANKENKENKSRKELKLKETKTLESISEEFAKLYNNGCPLKDIQKTLKITQYRGYMIYKELIEKGVIKRRKNSAVSIKKDETCPYCSSNNVIRNGIRKGKQRMQCNDCNKQFTTALESENQLKLELEVKENSKKRGLASVDGKCPHCGSDKLKKNGTSKGKIRFQCKECKKTFHALEADGTFKVPSKGKETKKEETLVYTPTTSDMEQLNQIDERQKYFDNTIKKYLEKELRPYLQEMFPDTCNSMQKQLIETLEQWHQDRVKIVNSFIKTHEEVLKASNELIEKEKESLKNGIEQATEEAPRESISSYFLDNIEKIFTSPVVSPLITSLLLTIYLLLMPREFLSHISASTFWVLILIPLYLIECIRGFIRSLK